ncbi:type II toxin-antitoxin system RelE/ParE family toxin [Providencia xihuensis]|uniref:type II toxin-antitoxin system RelE/ParE family toxin n=2 Tax=Morganellaceae TaxID=1903414 RepID=UPI0035C0BCE0
MINAVMDVFAGQYEAHLGSGVIKKRLPLQGKGKSGGVRTLIFISRSGTYFCICLAEISFKCKRNQRN